LKSRLKRSDSMAGSRNESGSEFHTVGPATEKARVVPNVLRRNCGIFSLRRLAERRCWQPETSETDTQQLARYLERRIPITPMNSHGELVLQPLCDRPMQRPRVWPKFHLARLDSTRHDSTRSTLSSELSQSSSSCRASRAVLLD